MKIALVCDPISAYGGAERVIEQILNVFPRTDVFSVLDVIPPDQRDFLKGRSVTSSFLQSFPHVHRYYRQLFHFWPYAVEQLDTTAYDLIISSHHSVAYGVLTRPGQLHVSYVHSPMRYAWDLQHEYLRRAKLGAGPLGMLARRTLHKARIWDYSAAQRPDEIVANSHFVASRLWHAHRRRAKVIYPPVDVDGIQPRLDKDDYYLSVGRLVPYKRVDLLVRAFAQMPERRLKIVGEGPEMKALQAIRPDNVELLGYRSTGHVRALLAGARGFLFAGTEDFGIVAVEAQAAGTPVIAYGAGGLTETIIGETHPQPTGLFFKERSAESIVQAVEDFEENINRFVPAACVANAQRFNEARFRHEFAECVTASMAVHCEAMPLLGARREQPLPAAVALTRQFEAH